MAIKNEESRTEDRVKLSIPIDVVSVQTDSPQRLVSYDISPDGVYVSGSLPLTVGDNVICTFHLPTSPRPFAYYSKVVHAHGKWVGEKYRPAGFGIEFLDTHQKERTAVRIGILSVSMYAANAEANWFYEI